MISSNNAKDFVSAQFANPLNDRGQGRACAGTARDRASGGDHTQHLSCGSERVPIRRIVGAQCILQGPSLLHLSRCLAVQNVAGFAGKLRGNARGT